VYGGAVWIAAVQFPGALAAVKELLVGTFGKQIDFVAIDRDTLVLVNCSSA